MRQADRIEAERRPVGAGRQHRFAGIVDDETLRHREADAERRMDEAPVAHVALARVVAEDEAVDAVEIAVAVDLADPGRAELARGAGREFDPFRRRRVRAKEVGPLVGGRQASMR